MSLQAQMDETDALSLDIYQLRVEDPSKQGVLHAALLDHFCNYVQEVADTDRYDKQIWIAATPENKFLITSNQYTFEKKCSVQGKKSEEAKSNSKGKAREVDNADLVELYQMVINPKKAMGWCWEIKLAGRLFGCI